MGKIMNEKVQVFRTEEQLKSALEDVRALKQRYAQVGVEAKGKVFYTDLLFHAELGFMIDCAEMVCVAAIERKEGRGAHYRLDYPQRDDANWLFHITCSYTPQGPQLGQLPVTLTRWELQERKY
jgi:succinate dehydrogenase / fumarate reductase flavoprotein subunit